ncbi:MAG: PKD domain-containing protein, partial [Nocardioidaceae bacterium]
TTPVSSPGIDWSSVRGAAYLDGSLYTAWADGHLYKRSFDGTTFGAPQDVDLNGLTNFASEMQSMTGMFYENGRLYFTRAGSPKLEMRYFTVESDVVGAGLRDLQPFTVANNLSDLDWTRVRGMFLASDRLYWSDRTNGNLHRINWQNGAPVAGTDVVVSGPGIDGVDWRQRALFADAS